MNRLKDIVENHNKLAEGLQDNAMHHNNYKNYTSMDRAIETLMSGYIYLSNASRWNDKSDRLQMVKRKLYGICFSCSTQENVAMWMLYSGDRGKQGAMLNYPNSVIMGILNTEEVELGYFEKGEFVFKTLSKPEFDIFATDILYVDRCKDDKSKISLNDEHVTIDDVIIDGDSVFIKSFPWAYEKESRIIVNVKNELDEDYYNKTLVRIRLSKKSLRLMNKERIIKSPVYQGDIHHAKKSQLFDSVDWEL